MVLFNYETLYIFLEMKAVFPFVAFMKSAKQSGIFMKIKEIELRFRPLFTAYSNRLLNVRDSDVHDMKALWLDFRGAKEAEPKNLENSKIFVQLVISSQIAT